MRWRGPPLADLSAGRIGAEIENAVSGITIDGVTPIARGSRSVAGLSPARQDSTPGLCSKRQLRFECLEHDDQRRRGVSRKGIPGHGSRARTVTGGSVEMVSTRERRPRPTIVM
jgi:hypothetical protein